MEKSIDLTIICVYNNKNILNTMLLESLNHQNVKSKTLLFDNSDNYYSSAAKAYSDLIETVQSKYVLFVHQDIIFDTEDSLINIYKYMLNNKESIVGVVGVKINDNKAYGTIREGVHGEYSRCFKIESAITVDAVDECCFGGKVGLIRKVGFDSDTCNGFHLYAVDLCYAAKKMGIETCVVPSQLIHVSLGNLSHDFFIRLKKLRNKYKKNFKYIRTCCIQIETAKPVFYYELKYMKKIYIKHILQKFLKVNCRN